jgi:hypothetical protein
MPMASPSTTISLPSAVALIDGTPEAPTAVELLVATVCRTIAAEAPKVRVRCVVDHASLAQSHDVAGAARTRRTMRAVARALARSCSPSATVDLAVSGVALTGSVTFRLRASGRRVRLPALLAAVRAGDGWLALDPADDVIEITLFAPPT